MMSVHVAVEKASILATGGEGECRKAYRACT
jgi:hypothetical protein